MSFESKHIISLLIFSIILIVLYMSYGGKDKRYRRDKRDKRDKSVKENFVDEIMREDNNTFSLFNWEGDESEYSIEQTIENFPQSTPMNVIYTDTNGNLSNTSDLGLQNLTVNSDTKIGGSTTIVGNSIVNGNSTVGGNSTFNGVITSTNAGVEINGADLGGPGANTRINSEGIIFGGANNRREVNSAQISAGRHIKDSLCIVGMSDSNGANRKINMWAEGGTNHYGGLQVNGVISSNTNISASGSISASDNINTSKKILEGGNSLIPRGTIVMWNGDTAPAGWALCDGGNGTPDLRNRFIVGIGNKYGVGSTGGADTVALNVEQIPSHSHPINNGGSLRIGSADGQGTWLDLGGWHNGRHYDNVSIGNTGGGAAHENRPPYYALAYIMKL